MIDPEYTMAELRFDRIVTTGTVTYVDVAARSTRYQIFIVDISGIKDSRSGWLVTLPENSFGSLPILPGLDGWHRTYLAGYLHDEHAGSVVTLVLDRLGARRQVPGGALERGARHETTERQTGRTVMSDGPALPYEEAQRLLAMSRALATDELADDTKRMIRRNAMIANDTPKRGPGQIVRTEWSDAQLITGDGDPAIVTVARA